MEWITLISILFYSTRWIHSTKQEYSVQLTFREQWIDERLKFDDIQGTLHMNCVLVIGLDRNFLMPNLTEQQKQTYVFAGRLKYLTLTEANRVWMPDLFFSNEKEGHFHNIIMPNVYIRIFPNGSVLYSIRISLTLACPMNLKLYPLDRQVCSLRMASCKLNHDLTLILTTTTNCVQFSFCTFQMVGLRLIWCFCGKRAIQCKW